MRGAVILDYNLKMGLTTESISNKVVHTWYIETVASHFFLGRSSAPISARLRLKDCSRERPRQYTDNP